MILNKHKIWDNERLIAVFSSRLQNMSLNYGLAQDSLNNRKEFLAGFGVDYRDLVCAKQAHGSHVECVGEKDKGRGAVVYDDVIADTDAFITASPNVPLAIFTADCLPVFLHDFSVPVIGIIHAGWRSLHKDIITKTIQLMAEKFNIRANGLHIGFGPSIRKCCYEVSGEFNDYFTQGLTERNKRYYLDLTGVAQKQLLSLGVKKEHIFDSQICTFCRSSEFFSYRKEGLSSGRMMSVIMLRRK